MRTRCGEPVGAGLLRRLRERGLGTCARHPDPDTAGLLAALLFGDTSRLPCGLADLFTRTGTRHLLALSGLHVALLAVLLGVPLARAMAAIATFALRPGRAPQRRFAMRCRWRSSRRSSSPCPALAPRRAAPRSRWPARRSHRVCRRLAGPGALDLLGLALVIEVLVDPIAPARPGVQLSLPRHGCARRGGARRPADRRRAPGLREPAPVRGSGRRRRPLPRALHLTVARVLGLGTGASVVATIATLPVIWSVFGEASWAGIVLTTLAMPAVTALIAGGRWIAAPDLFPCEALTWCAHGLVALHTAFDHFPGTPLVLPARPLWAIASASGLAIAALRTGNGRAGRLAALAFGLLIAPLPIGAARPPGALEVHVMDVGDGTAIVARAPGASPLLVDAGSRDRSAVARAAGWLLRALDAGPLRIVLTHDHADHARDLPWLARRFGAARWIGPLPAVDGGRSLGPPPWRGAALAGQVEHSEATDGLRVVAGEPFEGNEGRVAELTCPTTGARVVLSGDAEAHGLEQLLEPGGLSPGPIAALLLPHHGSRSRQRRGRLLDHLEPREVWVSASEVPSTAAIECERRGSACAPRASTANLDVARSAPIALSTVHSRSPPIEAGETVTADSTLVLHPGVRTIPGAISPTAPPMTLSLALSAIIAAALPRPGRGRASDPRIEPLGRADARRPRAGGPGHTPEAAQAHGIAARHPPPRRRCRPRARAPDRRRRLRGQARRQLAPHPRREHRTREPPAEALREHKRRVADDEVSAADKVQGALDSGS